MNYWEERYQEGGPSNTGQVVESYRWMWSVIKKYDPHPEDIIDVGCGDLTFWKGRDCLNYLGIDISPTILKKNWKERPNWKFNCQDAATPISSSAKTVLCFNVLFHIVDDEDYLRIIENLTKATEKLLFIFTWTRDPYRTPAFILRHPGAFVHYALGRSGIYGIVPHKFRPMDNSLFVQAGLVLIGRHICPLNQGIGTMYVYERKKVKPFKKTQPQVGLWG